MLTHGPRQAHVWLIFDVGQTMITRTQATFVVTGKRFTPSIVQASFSDAHDPGVIGDVGRYRGVPVPYGSAQFTAPEDESEKIAWIHCRAFPLLSAIREAGAEHLTLHVTYTHDAQCALSFTREELKMILDLDCDLHVDCQSAT